MALPKAGWWGWHRASRALAHRQLDFRVHGLDHVPRRGPVLIAARHFHHFYDGLLLVGTIARPVHIVVATDWIASPPVRGAMDALLGAVAWPAVVRTDALASTADGDERARRLAGSRRALRQGMADAVNLLRAGELVVVFPEGYPNVDPNPTPKLDDDAFLPFQPGFAGFVSLAQGGDRPPVPIIPVGFRYARGDRWRADLRFGPPLFLPSGGDRAALVADVEARVRELSGYAP